MAMGLLHVVLIKARPDVDEATFDLIFRDLKLIKAAVPGIGEIIAGRSRSPEGIERGYTHGFTIEMESFEVLQSYQAHPDHRAVGVRLVAATQGGIDGILVLDIPYGDG